MEEELRASFRLFDKDGDGRITDVELRDVLAKMGMPVSLEEVRAMIRSVDADSNGTVEFDEFVRAVEMRRRSMSGGDDEAHWREVFAMFDSDSNGKISAEELQRVMTNFGQKMTLEEAKSMIRDLDVDGDGEIDFDEFRKMLKA